MKLKKISIMALACAVSLGFLGCGEGGSADTVSYTHLTLPTNTLGCRSRWSPYH